MQYGYDSSGKVQAMGRAVGFWERTSRVGVGFGIVLSLVFVGFNPTVGFYIILLYMSRIIHICYKKTGQAHWIRIIGLSFDDDHEFDSICYILPKYESNNSEHFVCYWHCLKL